MDRAFIGIAVLAMFVAVSLTVVRIFGIVHLQA